MHLTNEIYHTHDERHGGISIRMLKSCNSTVTKLIFEKKYVSELSEITKNKKLVKHYRPASLLQTFKN